MCVGVPGVVESFSKFLTNFGNKKNSQILTAQKVSFAWKISKNFWISFTSKMFEPICRLNFNPILTFHRNHSSVTQTFLRILVIVEKLDKEINNTSFRCSLVPVHIIVVKMNNVNV